MGAALQTQKSSSSASQDQQKAQGQTPELDSSILDQLPQELQEMLMDAVGHGNGFIQEILAQQDECKGEDEEKSSKKGFEKSASGTQTTYTPTNRANGKTLYFFYGYTGSNKDVKMKGVEDDYLTDDLYAAVNQGFQVVYDTAGTKDSFLKAVYDSSASGIYWSGHGYPNGDIQSSDGSVISPSHIDSAKVGGNCQYLILATCNSGVAAEKWKKAMGSQCAFQGWVKTTTTTETIDFTDGSAGGAWLDSWSSHNGTNPNMELRDYINAAGKKVNGSR